jgi:hypothetical protein
MQFYLILAICPVARSMTILTGLPHLAIVVVSMTVNTGGSHMTELQVFVTTDTGGCCMRTDQSISSHVVIEIHGTSHTAPGLSCMTVLTILRQFPVRILRAGLAQEQTCRCQKQQNTDGTYSSHDFFTFPFNTEASWHAEQAVSSGLYATNG